jgi:hypothetical protein
MKAINVPSPVARCRARAVCFLVAAVRRFGSSDQSLSGEGSSTANTKPEARSPKIISSLYHRRVNTVNDTSASFNSHHEESHHFGPSTLRNPQRSISSNNPSPAAAPTVLLSFQIPPFLLATKPPEMPRPRSYFIMIRKNSRTLA